MIKEMILNSFAKYLSKRDREALNSATRSIIANPRTFLDRKTFNDYQDWLYYNGGSDRALSPVTLRVFSIVADKMSINAVHVYELWVNDQLIFYPDVPGRLTPTMLDKLIALEYRASKLVDAGKKIYLAYNTGENGIGVMGLFQNKCRGQKPFYLSDVRVDIPFFEARRHNEDSKSLNDIRKENRFDPVPSKSNYDEYSPYRNTKKLIKLLNPSITSKEYKQQYEESWDVKFNKTAHQQFRVFKKGLRKVSQVKFANPELIYLTVQARTKLNYPYNIYALCEDDTLGKYYLEKVMSIISLHYENWEV